MWDVQCVSQSLFSWSAERASVRFCKKANISEKEEGEGRKGRGSTKAKADKKGGASKLQSFCVIRHKKRLRRGDQVKGARDGECRRCTQ